MEPDVQYPAPDRNWYPGYTAEYRISEQAVYGMRL